MTPEEKADLAYLEEDVFVNCHVCEEAGWASNSCNVCHGDGTVTIKRCRQTGNSHRYNYLKRLQQEERSEKLQTRITELESWLSRFETDHEAYALGEERGRFKERAEILDLIQGLEGHPSRLRIIQLILTRLQPPKP